MKTATFLKTALALGAAAVLATSCNKEEHNNMITDEGAKSVVLKIDLGQTGTKAMTPDDAWSQQEDVVSNIAIYFTDKNDIIKYAYKADANASDDAAIIWNHFQKGVRFIGMEGISRVYVVANGGADNEIVTFTNGAYVNDNENMSIRDLNFDIEKFGPTAEQNGVPFVGADIVLESVETVAGGENAVIIDPDAEGGPYFSAKVSIRPVLSRLEITQVSIQESGTLYFTENAESGILKQCAEDAPEAMYRFDYSGFDAVLTGVYMSNFYRDSKLIPTPSDLIAWDVFANPGGTSPIVNGDWGSPLQNEYQSIARYTGWTGTAYAALVGSEFEKTEGTIKYLFDGSTESKVIPFHFLFPYDVTSEEQEADAVANPVIPQLSFQFIPAGAANEILTDNFQYKNQDTWEDITNNSTIAMLKGEVMWPHTTGQSSQEEVYANVVNFATNAEGTTPAEIMTGKIYKIQNVLVTPAALATTTQATDGSNIIVEVKIVPFTEENVYPVFE